MEQSGILFHRPNKNQIVVEHLWSEPPEFSALPRKKKLGKLFSMLQGGGPVEKILWQTIHRWIRNTKRQGRFVSTSRNLKQRLLDRVGRLKCCRDTMRTNFYRPEGPAFVGSGCCGCRLLVFDAATVSRIQFAQHNVSSVHGVRVTVFLLPSCA